MFKFMLVFILLASPAYADDWSKADIQREAVYLVLHTIDLGQTRWLVKNPCDIPNCTDPRYETNKILGKYPSVGEVNRYFVGAAILQIGIAHVLPAEYRKWWQYLSIVEKGAFVGHNYRIGIRVDLP